jgi:uncharacterized membrane protein
MKPFISSRIAEIVFALCFAAFGALHIKNGKAWAGTLPHHMPGGGALWVYVIGIIMILAAIAILARIQKTTACYLLAIMLIIFLFLAHWNAAIHGNPGDALRDAALAMGAILIGNRRGRR